VAKTLEVIIIPALGLIDTTPREELLATGIFAIPLLPMLVLFILTSVIGSA